MVRILITGAKGQLGLALGKLIKEQKQYDAILTSHTPSLDIGITGLDITDEQMVRERIARDKPDIIINCAAMTAVDLCESEQDFAYRANALGPKYLAAAAEECGSKLVHISTDYVFDGMSNRSYIETDPTNPINVYGRTKLEGENLVLQHCCKAMILRTAWIYGEGRNFVRTMLRLAEGGNRIRVVSDQYGTPTSAMELARVILFLIKTEQYGIYHASCEGMCSWYEFARLILEYTGREVQVEAIATSEYPTPAKRPMYSVMDNKALRERHGYCMKDWKDALQEYITSGL